MRKFTFIALALLPTFSFAQQIKYTINGSLNARYNAPAKVYLQYHLKGKYVEDSVIVQHGKFHFAGKIDSADPLHGYLVLGSKGTGPDGNDYSQFYLETGNIIVTSPDSMTNARVEGTKTNIDNTEYYALIKPVNDAYSALYKSQNAATPEQQKSDQFVKENNEIEKKIESQEIEVKKKFISTHPDSYHSLNLLADIAYSADYADIAPLYNGLSASIKNTESGKEFRERLPHIKAVALGAIAPEFTEADTSGKIVSLVSFRGKYVLIDFWASWCGPCRHENPNVVKAFNHFKGQNFTIIGVSLDRPDGKKDWEDAIKKDGLTWTQVSDLKFWDSETAGLYAVHSIPQNFLLDPEGKIIAKNLHGDDLEERLQQVLGR